MKDKNIYGKIVWLLLIVQSTLLFSCSRKETTLIELPLNISESELRQNYLSPQVGSDTVYETLDTIPAYVVRLFPNEFQGMKGILVAYVSTSSNLIEQYDWYLDDVADWHYPVHLNNRGMLTTANFENFRVLKNSMIELLGTPELSPSADSTLHWPLKNIVLLYSPSTRSIKISKEANPPTPTPWFLRAIANDTFLTRLRVGQQKLSIEQIAKLRDTVLNLNGHIELYSVISRFIWGIPSEAYLHFDENKKVDFLAWTHSCDLGNGFNTTVFRRILQAQLGPPMIEKQNGLYWQIDSTKIAYTENSSKGIEYEIISDSYLAKLKSYKDN